MARPVFDRPNDVTVYLVEEDFGHLGRAYLETDAAEADRETIVRNFISGQYRNAIRIVAFNTAEGWSRDVSEDIANAVLDQAYDADDSLSEDTKRFIEAHHRRRETAAGAIGAARRRSGHPQESLNRGSTPDAMAGIVAAMGMLDINVTFSGYRF
jgi:hypothetical protein